MDIEIILLTTVCGAVVKMVKIMTVDMEVIVVLDKGGGDSGGGYVDSRQEQMTLATSVEIS